MSNKEEKAGKHGGRRPLVPRLRFPEFWEAGEWTIRKLEDISVPVDERVGDRKLIPVSISAGIGFVPQAEKFGRDISGNQYRLYTVVRDGDFVYNKGNSLKFPQGCVYDLQGWGEVAAPNVFICFRLKSGYENGFFRQYFEQNVHGLQLRKHISSGARSNGLLNLSRDTFFGVIIPTPRVAEQQKIADCLSSLDDLITLESQKLNALKTHKKGLMQQLFPAGGETVPRLRFPEFREAGEWIKTKICDAVIYESSTLAQGKLQITSGGYPVFGADGIVGYIGFFDQKEDYIAIVKDGSGAGRLTFTKGRSSILSTLGCLRPKSIARTETLWLFYCLLSLNLKNHIKGSGIPHLYFSDYGKEEIGVPAPGEQQKIADCLSSLDDLITAQAQKVEVLKKHKKGLMQQLFPVLDDAIG